jgi:DNA-binding NarL/FixJ family response regulator
MFPPMDLPRTSTRTERPKVLLADNHPQVLKIVAHVLASDFDVVGAVSDGRQALDLSVRLDPDVILLDIGMPELDGFQTLQELRRTGSRAKVVMLTMYDSDAYITSAVNEGAQGYVSKSCIYTDLVSAIDHALDERCFVPSLTSLTTAGRSHAAQFHRNDRNFVDGVARFAGGILRSGEPMIVIGNPETRTGIAQRLTDDGTDVRSMLADGQYVELDSREALSQFMRGGRPDATCINDMVADLENRRSARGPQTRLTLFGDMAAVLCLDGNFEAALELEHIWENRTRNLPFFTVCNYSADCFEDPKARELFPKVCAEHGAVTHTFN